MRCVDTGASSKNKVRQCSSYITVRASTETVRISRSQGASQGEGLGNEVTRSWANEVKSVVCGYPHLLNKSMEISA